MDTQLSNQPPVQDRLALDYETLRDEITAALTGTDSLVEIASDEDVLAARELVAPLKALQNKCAAAHKVEKAFYLDGGRQVDGYFKALRVHLDSVVALITEEASAYQTRKLAEARAKAAEEARTAALFDEKPPEPPRPASATRVSDNGSVVASGSVRWTYQVVDDDAIPRELMTINEAAIKARIAGLKATMTIEEAASSIPGLRIFEKVQTVFR